VAGQSLERIDAKGMRALLEKAMPEMARAFPKHMTGERLARIALTEFRRTPKLAECDPRSFVGAIIKAAQLGLEPGVLGQCYLIPYKAECQFVPGWQGLVDLLSRTGRATVWTGAVYEGDHFDYALGSAPRCEHRPCGEDDPRKLTHVYACGKVNGADTPNTEVWPIAKVWKHRDRFNKVGRAHYSYEHPEMYARKVVLLQVLKYMPKSVELTAAIRAEHAATTGEMADAIDVSFEPVPDAAPAREPGDDGEVLPGMGS
jgi:recombination protein RecT